jgi:GntR family transcriptional regulator
MEEVNRSSPLPLYAQVKEILQHEIEARAPGDMLPIEPELEKRFGVSRITIRRALDELETEGRIVRLQGKGTFVREPGVSYDLAQLVSWSHAMRQLGYDPQTFSCEFAVVEPPHEVRPLLNPRPEEPILRIRRLRGVNNQPLCIMTDYLREQLVPDLARQGLIDGSLYHTLLARDIRIVRAEDKVEARLATKWEAERLQLSLPSPLLQVTHQVYDAAGRAVAVGIVASRADKNSYRITFGIPQREEGTNEGDGANFPTVQVIWKWADHS